MTIYRQTASQVTVGLTVLCNPSVNHPFEERALYPLRRTRLTMPDYRLYQGIPMPVPSYDVRSTSSVTCNAAVATNTRPTPNQVSPTSIARWLPTAATYAGSTWSALAGGTRSLSAVNNPVRTDTFSYYVGKELVSRQAMVLSTTANNYFTTNFTPATDSEWCLLLVGIPLPPERNALGQSDYYGVLETTSANPDVVGLRQYASALQYHQGAMYNTTKLALSSSSPTIYAISATATTVRYYRRNLGYTWSLTLARSGSTWSTALLLGQTRDLAHGANMAIMEVNYYNSKLSDDAFELEASNIYSAYGNYAGVS